MRISMLWKRWYGDQSLNLDFPNKWEVKTASMKDAPSMSEEDIRIAFAHPVDTARIAELAQGKETVAIAADDISRPTCFHRVFAYLIRELKEAGVDEHNICIITALGAHRPMTRQDCIKKYGRDVVDRIQIYNHHPYENLVDLGISARGTPIRVNRYFMEADLKIGVGCVVTHPNAGFSGGGKIVVPGISGIETLEANHQAVVIPDRGKSSGKLGVVEGNENRLDIEEISRKVGLDVVVNVVSNPRCQIAGLYVGDLVGAHRKAVELARRTYATEVPMNMDVGIFNAYPKDTEIIQASNALNVYGNPNNTLVREGGSIVIITASSEGAGFHSLHGPGMRLYIHLENHPTYGKIIKGKNIIVFSPNLNLSDIRKFYPQRTVLAKNWDQTIRRLRSYHANEVKIVVFPYASMQFSQKSNS